MEIFMKDNSIKILGMDKGDYNFKQGKYSKGRLLRGLSIKGSLKTI